MTPNELPGNTARLLERAKLLWASLREGTMDMRHIRIIGLIIIVGVIAPSAFLAGQNGYYIGLAVLLAFGAYAGYTARARPGEATGNHETENIAEVLNRVEPILAKSGFTITNRAEGILEATRGIQKGVANTNAITYVT